MLEGTVRIGGKAFRLIGIEPLTIPEGTSLGAVQGSERSRAFPEAAVADGCLAGDT